MSGKLMGPKDQLYSGNKTSESWTVLGDGEREGGRGTTSEIIITCLAVGVLMCFLLLRYPRRYRVLFVSSGVQPHSLITFFAVSSDWLALHMAFHSVC